jgi:hypothetical protein
MEYYMLTIVDHLPPGLLEVAPLHLHDVLAGPTLIQLKGRRQTPLFISVLLHGNEITGFLATQTLLRHYTERELPRSLSIFIGNVTAARCACRRLEGQPDYNRIWKRGEGGGGGHKGADTPEHAMAQQVLEEMRRRGAFACVDVHNNTGLNPHYACVTQLDQRFLHLASLFSRTVVYFLRPDTVLSRAFARLCPSITVECGQPGTDYSVSHTLEFLEACLHLSEFPTHPVAEHDIDIYHTVATVRVPATLSFGFGKCSRDLCFTHKLDHLNFRELPAGTALGRLNVPSDQYLEVLDDSGNIVTNHYFRVEDCEIRTICPVTPAMFTVDEQAIRQDCLGYFMERYSAF